MTSIDPDVEATVLVDFRRRGVGQDSVAGATYVYDLTRLLYGEVKAGPYPAGLLASLGFICDIAGSAQLYEFARTHRTP